MHGTHISKKENENLINGNSRMKSDGEPWQCCVPHGLLKSKGELWMMKLWFQVLIVLTCAQCQTILACDSLKKSRRSKYRVVQYWYDVVGWFRRFVTATWDALTGGGSSELGEILRGIHINASESRLREIGPRLGAAMLALVTVSMVGAIYALAPKFLAIIAVFTGVMEVRDGIVQDARLFVAR
jgi:hypothetical protein